MDTKFTPAILVVFSFIVVIQVSEAVLSKMPPPPIYDASSSISPIEYPLYDYKGRSLLSSSFPYFSFYNSKLPKSLFKDLSSYSKMLDISNSYGIPLPYLYNLYDTINSNVNLHTNMDLSILENLAQAFQQQKLYYNQYPETLLQGPPNLSIDDLQKYVPKNLPTSYLYNMAYANSLIPSFSKETLHDIRDSIYKHIPLKPKAESLYFQMQMALRFMMADQMTFIPYI